MTCRQARDNIGLRVLQEEAVAQSLQGVNEPPLEHWIPNQLPIVQPLMEQLVAGTLVDLVWNRGQQVQLPSEHLPPQVGHTLEVSPIRFQPHFRRGKIRRCEMAHEAPEVDASAE